MAPRPHGWPAWALGVGLAVSAQADPTIALQPTNSTVSLGATVEFRVTASTDNPPVQYQWQRAGATTPLTFTNLPGATDSILRLTNVPAGQSGFYQAVVCNGNGGCLTSHVAELKVDPTFLKISGQPIVEDVEPTQSGSWHDYDGDGYLDLLVLNSSFQSAPRNSLYHNDRKGFFTRVTNALSTLSASSWVGVWGDFDNDGRSDVYVSHPKFFNGYVADTLYRNQGDGVFAGVVTPWLTNRNRAESFQDVSWVDLDMDGWVDLFATVWSVVSGNLTGRQSVAFQNLSDGGFQSLPSGRVGSLVTDSDVHASPAFADFDNDGDLDVYVPSSWGSGQNRLHRNAGPGFFEPVQLGSLPADPLTINAIWVDYDNDGDFDLFATHIDGSVSLHQNVGAAGFEDVTAQAGLETVLGEVYGLAWGDYDNDGDLDLFFADYVREKLNQLFVNHGDGTFTRTDVGSPIHDDNAKPSTPRWVDYDNDGFLDLFVACGETVPTRNLLYRNNLRAAGSTNHWLKIRLQGTASNRDGIGAKIRVTARIGGREVRQLRQIASGGWIFGSDLLAHFGLGDATRVDTLRIEWPSGIVQEFKDVAVDPKPYLTVVETQDPPPDPKPGVIAQSRGTAGVFEATVAYPVAHLRCVLEASSDLVQWTKIQVRTNAPPAALEFADPGATNTPTRFYRVVVP